MENVERLVIERASKSDDFHIKKLLSQHKELDRKVEELANRPFLTDEEEIEFKKLKKEKLKGKDELTRLIESYGKKEMHS